MIKRICCTLVASVLCLNCLFFNVYASSAVSETVTPIVVSSADTVIPLEDQNTFAKYPELHDDYRKFSEQLVSDGIVPTLCFENFVHGYLSSNSISVSAYISSLISAAKAVNQVNTPLVASVTSQADIEYLEAKSTLREGTISSSDMEVLSAYEILISSGSNLTIPYQIFYDTCMSSNYSPSDVSASILSSSLEGEWYDNMEDTYPSLPRAASYNKYNLLSVVDRGDVIHETEGLVAQVTGHIAISQGIFYDSTYEQYYIRTVEANAVGVVRGVLDDTRYVERGVRIYEVSDATFSQMSAAATFCESQIGKPYNWNAILNGTQVTQCNSTRSAGSWYCSELAWAAYYNQGFNLYRTGAIPYNIFMPAALASSSLLTRESVSAS